MAMNTMRDVQYYVDTTSLLNDPEALRRRARQDGCLFFEGLLPQSDVLDVRQQVLGVCARHGWLAQDNDLMEGIVHAERKVIESSDPRWKSFYCDVLKLRACATQSDYRCPGRAFWRSGFTAQSQYLPGYVSADADAFYAATSGLFLHWW